ncbi:zinc finger and SCAN domain-containing protein 31-like isoform X3 [Coregonus clupeaformis]|uniref:zinc finger and SCAN domain-containing protein 31-like isoform X3 n=1 Tax=Coregonus clupeaformis TaxID=59861 RepID=UPI001E1C88B5|nr:zinc finger and SCAN domain-containing protein 31-like isoform X3 [Coregonus clupeaformis]
MASCNFQAQFVSIMEVLAKAAVAEINKRVDDSCAVIRLEITQSQRDIDVLKRKCQMMESELKKTRRRKGFYPMASERTSYPVKIVSNKQRSTSQWRDREMAVEGDSQPQPTDVEQRVETEPILIKDEETAEDVWKADPQEELKIPGEESGSKPGKPPYFEQRHCDEDFITQPNISPEESVEFYPNSDHPEEPGTPRLASTEVFSTEQHRPAEDSLDLVMVKNEKEEELDQTTALAGPDQFVMDETDGQLWTSVDPGRDTDPDGHPDFSFHATEEYSQNISIFPSHSGLPSVPKMTDDVVPSLHSSLWKPHANMFSVAKHMTRHVRTLADETRQQMPEGESSERLNSNNEGNSLALHPRQHQYGASESTVRLSECMTRSNMATTSTFSGYSLSRNSFNMVKRMRTQWRSGGDTTERRFSCTFCGKSFQRFSELKVHLRSHTGEKPYTCEQCGRSFTKTCNLIRHAVVHSGEKPYECTQCGKCFTQRSNMTSHQRTHIGESPVSQYVAPTYPGDPHKS